MLCTRHNEEFGNAIDKALGWAGRNYQKHASARNQYRQLPQTMKKIHSGAAVRGASAPRPSETSAKHAAANEDGDAAPKSVHSSLSCVVVSCQSAVFRRRARTAATPSDSAIPATHAGHPIRSKI